MITHRTYFTDRLSIFLISLFLLFPMMGLITSCHSRAVQRQQGICGIVVEKRGNFMPGPGKTNSGGTPVEREVLIFPLLNLSQIDAGENGFIRSVREAKPVKTVQSDKDGKFCVSLPVGRYSVIVREAKGLYANLSDTQNNIFPVNVQKNHQSTIKVEITHQAAF